MTTVAAGRPTKYKPEYCEQVTKLCLLGATNDEIADFFEVNVDTLYEWRDKHPEFSEAIKEGKIVADANVADRLYKRAMGYSHPEDKIFNQNGEAMIVPTTKHYPPDTAAAFIWLKNRRRLTTKEDQNDPLVWKDKQEQEISGPGGKPIGLGEDEIANAARRIIFMIKQGINAKGDN